MKQSNTYTLVFAGVVCVVCSLLLSATSAALKKQQDRMVELDRKRNVLKAFQVPVTDGEGRPIAAAAVDELFRDHISEVRIDPVTAEESAGGAGLPLYRWTENGEVTKYAFPTSGKGLWSTISAYLALDRNLETIIGVTFYKHGETPGLGGEISQPWFQAQFQGRKILKDGRLQRIEIVKGKVADRYPQGSDHAVDGISGATLTGSGINRFLNADLERYEPYFAKIRKGSAP